MTTNKEALDDVSYQIDLAIDAVRKVLILLDDCGFDKYDYELVKDGTLHCLRILDMAYDKVDFAKDEEEEN